jgi:hypothetical protein
MEKGRLAMLKVLQLEQGLTSTPRQNSFPSEASLLEQFVLWPGNVCD